MALKFKILALLFMAIAMGASAQTFYSRNGGGVWTAGGTWSTDGVLQHAGASCGCAPTLATQVVIIADNDVVTLPSNGTSNILSVSVGVASSGTLIYGDNTNTARTLNVNGDFIVGTNGIVQVGGNGGGTHTLNIGAAGTTNFTNNGSFNLVGPSGDVVNLTFTGAGTKTINGSSPTTTFNNVTVSGPVTYGDNANSRTLVINALTVGATLQSGSTAAVAHTIQIAGNLTNNSTFNLTANGATNQSLTFAGTGTMVGTAATTVTVSNLNVSTGIRTFGDNANGRTITVTNDFTISSGATFRSGNTVGQLHTLAVSGNLTNDGTFDLTVNSPTNQVLSFAGGASKIISGSGSFSTVILTLDKTASATITDNATSNIAITSTLTFNTDCLLIVGPNSNIVLGSAATVSGANSNRYIQLDGASTSGSQVIKTNSGNTAGWQLVFPIGTSTGGYTPFTITTVTTAPTANSTLSVKPILAGNNTGLLKRNFRIFVNGNSNATTFSNGIFGYNDATDISSGDAETDYTTAWRYEFGASWSIVASSVNTVANTFTVTGGTPATASLTSGSYLYTIGSPVTSHYSWYTYQTGNYDDYNTWTLDPSGTTFDNGLNLYPKFGDEMTILNGFTVTVNLSNQALVTTRIEGGGILDMSTTAGQTLGIVTGTGLLRVKGTSLPLGTYTDFVSSTGGTIEYYDIGGNLSAVQTTYNKLKMSNGGSSSSTTTFVLVSDLTVNGTFDLTTTGVGNTVTWQINDASNTQRNITLNSDLTVASGGRITVGTGNEGTTGTPPHNLTMYGNITNSGIIKFYDSTDPELNEADYGLTYPSPGIDLHRNELQGNAVAVTFSGAADKTVTCNNTTDFYRFMVDMGTGQQALLTVNSASTSFFRLFGPANVPTDESSGISYQYISSNALSLVNGTLQLTGSINIPVLQIDGSGTGYFPIPRNGALWLNGAGVTVQISDLTPDVFAGAKDGRILMSGLLRITAGTLNDGFSKGLGSQDGGAYLQEGGTVNCWQFRPRVGGSQIFSFSQTGGTMNVGYGYALSGGKIDTYEEDYMRFDLSSASSTFQMSGTAVLNVAKPTNNNGGVGGLFSVGSSAGNYSITGGTVNLYTGQETSTTSYPGYVNSTVPLYNVNISEESATADNMELQTSSLAVLNNLTINTGNTPSFVTNDLSVTVGGNFTINSGTTYTPGNGTTTFNGTGAQVWTNNQTITGLSSVVMNKASGTLTLAGTQAFPSITGGLTLTSGTLADGGKTITVTGSISNSATHSGAGSIVVNGATTIGGSNGTFGNLTVTTNNTVSVAGNQTLSGNLQLNGATTTILNIGANNLTVLGTITTTGTLGASYNILTIGLHNAGGLTRLASAAADLVFPVGSAAVGTNPTLPYTPVTINVTSATTFGRITVRPVNSEHPVVTSTSHSLVYYWRVTSTGFSGPSGVTHKAYTYSTAVRNGATNPYQTARYDGTAFTWSTTGSFNSGAGTAMPNFSFGTNIDGDYTCGDFTSPFGAVKVFYSRQTGVWNVNTTWSNSPCSGPGTCGAAVAAGAVAGTNFPGTNNPVVIGDTNNSHTLTIDTNSRNCGTLNLSSGSVLDCSLFNSLNFGTNTGGTVLGTGTLRIASANFPAGDFTNFIGTAGGTVEYYGNTNYTIPSVGPAPQNLSLASYYNLTVNPSSIIAMPASSLTIYNNLLKSGVGTLNTNAGAARTIAVTGDFNVSAGTWAVTNSFASTFAITGSTTVANGATLSVVAGAAIVHSFSTTGGLTNSGTLNFSPGGSRMDITFTGSNSVNLDGTGSGGTTLAFVTVNKGTSQVPTVNFTVGGTVTAATSGWLTLTNGTFHFNNANTYTLVSTATTYTIPATAKLKVSAGTVNVLSNASNTADLLLNGALEVAGGTVNIGAAANNNNNDLEYAAAGTPTITVSSGTLYVNGSVRRSTNTITGALVYNQTGGTVTVGGRSSNNTRGVFEIDANSGSNFTLTGASVLNVQRQTNGTSYADVFINPVTSNVAATSTITVGLATNTTQNNLRVNIAPSIGNFSVKDGAGTNAQTVNLYSGAMILGGTLTIPTPSVLITNSLDVSIAGDLSCTGTYTGGTNTTTFNGTGAQAGALSSTSTFNNLTINKTAGTTLTLSGTSPSLNNLNILSGILDVGSLALDVRRDITINSSQIGAGSVLINSTTANSNTITSTGGSFTNLTLGGSATSKIVTVIGGLTIKGTLNFSSANRYLMIGSNQLTFEAVTSAITGAGSTDFIRTNGVSSDLGVVKNWGTGASTFVYQIGTGSNYTPVSYSLTVGTAGTLTVIPVNSAHLTYYSPSPERILNYYWTVKRGGGLVASVTGATNHTYTYPSSLITGTGGSLVAAYLDTSNPVGWITSGHNGTASATQMSYQNTPTTNFPPFDASYDYSVGTPNTLPNPIVPLYSRLGVAAVANPALGGDWNVATNWTTETDGDPDNSNPGSVASAYPNGVPVVILAGARINTATNGRRAFRTTISGLLSNGSTTGHKLGIINGTGTFRTATNTFPAGVYTAFVASTGGTIEYVAPMTMNSMSTYNNLSIYSLSSGAVTMTASTLTINGGVTIPAGTTLNNSVNNASMSIAGNWSNSGAFTAGSGTVTFNGAAAQSTSGTTTFNNLTINKANNLTLGNTTTVSGILTLTNGNIVSNAYPAAPFLVLGSATLVGGSASSFISGQVRKTIASSGSFTFPVGSSASSLYRPVGIGGTTATSALADWDVSYVGSNPTTGGYSNLNFNAANMKKVSQFEYWQISRTGGATASVTLTYGPGSYLGGTGVGSLANLKIVRWSGTWDLPPGDPTYTLTGGSTTTAGSITITRQDQFSPETLASDDINSGLPITLLYFKGNRLDNSVQLNWKTEQEINNDRFEVERSEDGVEFNKIGNVKGAGNSKQPLSYLYLDKEISLTSNYYYRLRQVDFDGGFELSNVIQISPMGGTSWVIYPNPVVEGKAIAIENLDNSGSTDNVWIMINSPDGRVIFNRSGKLDDLNNSINNLIGELSSGVYLIQIRDTDKREFFRLVR